MIEFENCGKSKHQTKAEVRVQSKPDDARTCLVRFLIEKNDENRWNILAYTEGFYPDGLELIKREESSFLTLISAKRFVEYAVKNGFSFSVWDGLWQIGPYKASSIRIHQSRE